MAILIISLVTPSGDVLQRDCKLIIINATYTDYHMHAHSSQNSRTSATTFCGIIEHTVRAVPKQPK